jgi:hypothetical protein
MLVVQRYIHAVCMRFGIQVLMLYLIFANCNILGYTKINHKYHEIYMVYREIYIMYSEIYIMYSEIYIKF